MSFMSRSVPKSTVQYEEADYTVAWVCALPVPEWQASRLLFDALHEELDIGIRAQYQYVYGKINRHNVVMGCLPVSVIGESSAAAVMAEMTSIFPNRQFALLVGIAGGVWSVKHDVRLGDVVVSQPSRDPPHGGVRQYDFGKALPGQPLQDMSFLKRPSDNLLAGLGKHQSAPPGESQFYVYLEALAQHEDDMTGRLLFQRPEAEDVLYESTLTEVDKTASEPIAAIKTDRPIRTHKRPSVHYGLIASGNQVVKDASHRDAIVHRLGDVLAFEMEAAGIVNQKTSSLVIRGICDYCDSHKSKDWQPYAAAVAAAWAKEFLCNMVPWRVLPTRVQSQQLTKTNHKHRFHAKATQLVRRRRNHTIRTNIIRRMSSHNENDMVTGILSRRLHKSLLWVKNSLLAFVDSHRAHQHPHLLRFIGKVGSGKTFVMAALIESIQLDQNPDTILIHHISPSVPLTLVQVFTSYAKQLVVALQHKGISCPEDVAVRLNAVFEDDNRFLDLQVLVRLVIQPLISSFDHVIICFDGLNEYVEDEQHVIVESLLSLRTGLALSCRSIEQVGTSKEYGQIDVYVDRGNNSEDIELLIDQRLEQLSHPGAIFNEEALRARMKRALLDRADGMFLWVQLQLDVIRYCHSGTQAFRAIDDLPDQLERVFQRCMSQQHLGKPMCELETLKLIVAVKQPFTVLEFNEAMSLISPGADLERSLTSILQACCSLVVCQEGLLVPIHNSVTRYLFPVPQQQVKVLDTSRLQRRSEVILGLASVSLQHIQRHTQSSLITQGKVKVPTMTTLISSRLAKVWSYGIDTGTAPHEIQLHLLPHYRRRIAPAFLEYSIRTWVDHTREIYPSHSAYTTFKAVATTISNNRSVHPWTTGASRQLATSNVHLRGLFGHAVAYNHLPLLLLIIRPPPLLDSEILMHYLPGNKMLTPLQVAASAGYMEITRALLDAKLPLHQDDDHKLLDRTAEAGQVEILQLFIDVGIVKVAGKIGTIPLCQAILRQDLKMIQLLWDNEASVCCEPEAISHSKLDNALLAAVIAHDMHMAARVFHQCMQQAARTVFGGPALRHVHFDDERPCVYAVVKYLFPPEGRHMSDIGTYTCVHSAAIGGTVFTLLTAGRADLVRNLARRAVELSKDSRNFWSDCVAAHLCDRFKAKHLRLQPLFYDNDNGADLPSELLVWNYLMISTIKQGRENEFRGVLAAFQSRWQRSKYGLGTSAASKILRAAVDLAKDLGQDLFVLLLNNEILSVVLEESMFDMNN